VLTGSTRVAMSNRCEIAGLTIGDRFPVRIMAALNVSPESFYPGSVHADPAELREAALRAVEQGADLIDLGAMSTAPYGHGTISAREECQRLTRALEVVAAAVEVPLSADTTRAEVARAALTSGARIVNDVTGLAGDPGMAAVAAAAEGVILVAAEGAARRRWSLADVRGLLRAALARAREGGVSRSRIVLDPGIGFFPRALPSASALNCLLLRELWGLRCLGRPLLVGVSRKSFLGKLTGRTDPAERLAASLAATTVAVLNGAAVVRTHDVAATRDAVRVAEALARGVPGERGRKADGKRPGSLA
jgi:dihydropteroate synthase